MLPTNKPWYQKLLLASLVIGVFGGVSSLVFSDVTSYGIHYSFGDTGIGLWSGRWWWVPLTAFGGLLIAWLRQTWKIPDEVPDSIELAKEAWVDPESAPRLSAITVISLITGASLGPSYGLIVIGGGFGSWLATRLASKDNDDAKHDYALTGAASALGAAFSAPIFAAILASEISPTSKKNYVSAFIPQVIGATIGFVIFFGITGSVMLGAFELSSYQFEFRDLLTAVVLGIFSAIVLIVFGAVKRITTSVATMFPSPYFRGIAGGGIVGLIAFALPLTATSGTSQLDTLLQNTVIAGIVFVALVLLAKMFAIAISQSSGFLGGVVFPIIFIGGTAGVLVHSIFPAIPLSLAVAAMLVAVPGGFLDAPVSLILIAVGGVGLGVDAVIPIGIAVITARLCVSVIRDVLH